MPSGSTMMSLISQSLRLYVQEIHNNHCKDWCLGQLYIQNFQSATLYIYVNRLLWPLVMWEVHGPDACITARVDIEPLEVTGLPDLHHTVISTRHQVVAVAAQDNSLKI